MKKKRKKKVKNRLPFSFLAILLFSLILISVYAINLSKSSKIKIDISKLPKSALAITGQLKIESHGGTQEIQTFRKVAIGANNPGNADLYINGSVGIGITNPQQKLEIKANDGDSISILGTTGNDSANLRLITSTNHWNIDNFSGRLRFFTETGYGTGGIERVTIDSSGNVGIGTTAPSEKLDINGKIRATATTGHRLGNSTDTSRALSILNSSLASGSWYWLTLGKSASSYNQAEVGYYHVGDGSTSNIMRLGLYGVGVINITGGGNVGIGTTAPGQKLTIIGSPAIGVENASTLQAKNSSGTYETFMWPRSSDNVMYINYGSGGFNIRNNSSTSTMFMTNDNKVGIGTTAPETKLEINTSGSGYLLRLNGPGTANYKRYSFYQASNSLRIIRTNDDGSYGQDLLTIQGDGDIGIGGITDPTAKVHIDVGSNRFFNIGTPASLVGHSLVINNNRADLRFDGTYLYILPNVGTNAPPDDKGLVIINTGQGMFKVPSISAPSSVLHLQVISSQANNIFFSAFQRYSSGWTNLDNEFLFRTDGTANADGSWSGGGADVAEVFQFHEPVEPGDLVVFKKNNADGRSMEKHKGNPYDPFIAGVISTMPGLVAGNESAENTSGQPVSLVGRVPVKVSLENGPIRIGDPLTASSLSGVAMKATKPGIIIGRAMENYDGSKKISDGVKIIEKQYLELSEKNKPIPPPKAGIGKIMVFVNVSWYDPDVYLTSTGDLSIQGNEEKGFQVKNEKTGDIIERIGAFAEVIIGKIKAGLISAKKIVTETLFIGETDVGKKLKELEEKIEKQEKEIQQLKEELKKK